MPFYPFRIFRELLHHDVLFLNLPQLEAPVAAILAKLLRKPVVTFVHCDIDLPPGPVRLIFMPLIKASHRITGILSDVIVANSQDYADNSRYLQRFAYKLKVSAPPCCLAETTTVPNIEGSPVIGFVGRFAEEKGIGYLIDALPEILRQAPDAVIVLVGEWQNVIGERVYDSLKPRLDRLGKHVRLTGRISDEELAGYFHAFDVLVLPSVNSTEAFGIVQVEAMLAGTPVVATDLPGVREVVRMTGMGELVPPRDVMALARAILRVTSNPETYQRSPEVVERAFGIERSVEFHEAVIAEVSQRTTMAVSEPVETGKE